MGSFVERLSLSRGVHYWSFHCNPYVPPDGGEPCAVVGQRGHGVCLQLCVHGHRLPAKVHGHLLDHVCCQLSTSVLVPLSTGSCRLPHSAVSYIHT